MVWKIKEPSQASVTRLHCNCRYKLIRLTHPAETLDWTFAVWGEEKKEGRGGGGGGDMK